MNYRVNAAPVRQPWPKTSRMRLLRVWARELWRAVFGYRPWRHGRWTWGLPYATVFERWAQRRRDLLLLARLGFPLSRTLPLLSLDKKSMLVWKPVSK